MAMDECLRLMGRMGLRQWMRWLMLLLMLGLTGCANQFPAGMTPKPLAYGESLPLQPSAPLVRLVYEAQKKHEQSSVSPAKPSKMALNSTSSSPEPTPISEQTHNMDAHTLTLQQPSPEDSAVYPLSNGVEAFAARSALIKNAQYSLDLQYYLSFFNIKRGFQVIKRKFLKI